MEWGHENRKKIDLSCELLYCLFTKEGIFVRSFVWTRGWKVRGW